MASKVVQSGKSVLLYSGGLDSVCADHLLKPDVLVHVSTGLTTEETMAVLVLRDRKLATSVPVLVRKVLDLTLYKRTDFVVPNRNAHLLLLASNYGERLFMSTLAADAAGDTDNTFCAIMRELLNYTHRPSNWNDGQHYHVSAPFITERKRILVQAFLNAGHPRAALECSYSCYLGGTTHCGICKACIRRRIALDLNSVPGIYLHDYWTMPDLPAKLEGLRTLLGTEAMDLDEHLKSKGYNA